MKDRTSFLPSNVKKLWTDKHKKSYNMIALSLLIR